MRHMRRSCLALLLLLPLFALATDYDNPLAAIVANPQLSNLHKLLKSSGYAEPLATGGDVTFLALSNRFMNVLKPGQRFTTLEILRDKIPPEAQLQVFQALTLDGQYNSDQLDQLITAQGDGKAELPTVLKDAKFHLYRGKQSGSYILEDVRHNGLLLKMSDAVATENGTVIVIDADALIPK